MGLNALELGVGCGLGLAKLLSQGADMTKTSWWCMLLCLNLIFHRVSCSGLPREGDLRAKSRLGAQVR